MEKNRFIALEDNVLLGSAAICRYLGIGSFTTMIVWNEQFGLPVAKRPDGMWMTTVSAIDSWLFLASSAEAELRSYSRGTNVRADKALELAVKRAERAKSKLTESGVGHASRGGSYAGPFFTKKRMDGAARPEGIDENGQS